MKVTSLAVAAVVFAAGLSSAMPSDANELDPRSLQKRYLCDKANYGASGKPWERTSSPGWCVGKSNKWGSKLPSWDGGDSAKCYYLGKKGGAVCNGGNSPGKIPKGCKPPTTWVPWGPHTKTKTTKSCSTGFATVTVTATTTATTTVPTTTTEVVTTTATVTDGGAAQPICTTDANGDTYQTLFTNYTTTPTSGVYAGQTVGAATIDNDNYLTYGLADTVEQCLELCDQTNSCVFVNSYHDRWVPGLFLCYTNRD